MGAAGAQAGNVARAWTGRRTEPRRNGRATPPTARGPADSDSPPPRCRRLLGFLPRGSQRRHERQWPGKQHHEEGDQQSDREERQRQDGDLRTGHGHSGGRPPGSSRQARPAPAACQGDLEMGTLPPPSPT